MSGPPLLDRTTSRPAITSPILAMWSLFVGVALMMVANGLQGTLLGVRSTLEDFDTAVIGLISAAYYGGFLLGSRFTIRALGRVGHVRVFSALASMASTAALIYAVFVSPAPWFFMRFVTGFCMAGLYVVVESWLNDQTEPERRGRTLSMYMVVTMGGITGGQLLLNVADPLSFELFVIASVLVSMSLVPIALSSTSAPRIPEAAPLSFRELATVVPTGVVTMFLVGASAGALIAMGPVYATNIGMTTREISVFMAAAILGALLLQIPIGSLSDRFPRRGVMLVVALAAIAAAEFGSTTGTGWSAVVAMFVIGGASFPLYSLAIAYTNDWIDDSQRVGASGLLVMINGVGAILGPLLTSLAMRNIADSSYFHALALAHVGMAVYLIYRIASRPPLPVDEQSTYQPIPARSSALAAVIGRRRTPRSKTRS